MIISHFPSGGSGGLIPEFTYTGSYDLVAEAEGWKIRFLTSGTFTPKSNVTVDIFCVGGGGNGSSYLEEDIITDLNVYETKYGAGGGGGYTTTVASQSLTANTAYTVTVGSPGAASSFGALCTANGGQSATNMAGGDGGSGAASGSYYLVYTNGNYYAGQKQVSGGSNGEDGESGTIAQYTGIGQHTTTREFGESSGTLYASGGSAYGKWGSHAAPSANTGNGGNGTSTGSTSGASGIVIIRNARG